MTKFKLEYIWLDGYEPVPNLRGKTKIEEFDRFPDARGAPALGLRRQLDPAGGRQRLRLRPQAGRALPRSRPDERRARDVRGAAPGRNAASEQQPGDDPGRPGHVVRLRAGVLLLRRGLAARVPVRRRLPGAAGRVLHGRRAQERGLRRARDRRSPPRSLPRGRHQPRGHQRRGRQGAVGVPDLRQGLEAGRRRDVDRPLPAAAPLRAVRRRRQLALQAARRRGRLERLGDAHELLDEAHARGGWRGVLRGSDGRLRAEHGRSTSRCTGRTTTCA